MTKLAKDLDSHFTKEIIQPGASGSIYNPSHFGGRDQEDRSSKPALGRLKKKKGGGTGRVVQVAEYLPSKREVLTNTDK
jgi:hypothetical protein